MKHWLILELTEMNVCRFNLSLLGLLALLRSRHYRVFGLIFFGLVFFGLFFLCFRLFCKWLFIFSFFRLLFMTHSLNDLQFDLVTISFDFWWKSCFLLFDHLNWFLVISVNRIVNSYLVFFFVPVYFKNCLLFNLFIFFIFLPFSLTHFYYFFILVFLSVWYLIWIKLPWLELQQYRFLSLCYGIVHFQIYFINRIS